MMKKMHVYFLMCWIQQLGCSLGISEVGEPRPGNGASPDAQTVRVLSERYMSVVSLYFSKREMWSGRHAVCPPPGWQVGRTRLP